MKCIFKALIYFEKFNINHGNLSTDCLFFLDSGYTKLSGWYLPPRNNFVSDYLDACEIIYESVTLNINNDIENNSN